LKNAAAPLYDAGNSIEGDEKMRTIRGMGRACDIGERTDEKYAADATSIRLGGKGGGSDGSDGGGLDGSDGSPVGPRSRYSDIITLRTRGASSCALCERHSKTVRGRAGACWPVVRMAVRMVVRVVRMVV